MTAEKLKEILENHLHWIKQDCDGWVNMKADLNGAYLRGAYLSRADLGGADLNGADLGGADLNGADLGGAYLGGAYLGGAYLGGADLNRAYLNGAYLGGADLGGADLSGADLRGAYLGGAYLGRTDLTGADLTGADLTGAYLDKKLIDKFYPLACPESGSFIGWKKCKDGRIVKLEICEYAKRSSASGRKCRCSAAKVLEIQNEDGTQNKEGIAVSEYDCNFVYAVGTIVEVDDFDEDRMNECAPGIHFFITRQEAVDYLS